MNEDSGGKERGRSNGRVSVVFLLLMLLALAGLLAARSLRRQRRSLVVLQRRIDAAAGPGEAVVMDDRWIAFEVEYGTPRALRLPVALLEQPEEALRNQGEILLVTAETDPVLTRLRSTGYGVQPDTMAMPSDLYASRRVMVYFVTARAMRR